MAGLSFLSCCLDQPYVTFCNLWHPVIFIKSCEIICSKFFMMLLDCILVWFMLYHIPPELPKNSFIIFFRDYKMSYFSKISCQKTQIFYMFINHQNGDFHWHIVALFAKIWKFLVHLGDFDQKSGNTISIITNCKQREQIEIWKSPFDRNVYQCDWLVLGAIRKQRIFF